MAQLNTLYNWKKQIGLSTQVAICLSENVVYDSRGRYARLDDSESVWIVDVARNRVRVTALRVIRTGKSIMRKVVVRSTRHNQRRHCDRGKHRNGFSQEPFPL